MTPLHFAYWLQGIRKALRNHAIPSHSEIIKPLRFDYEHYGRYLAARERHLQFTLNQL